MLFTWERSFDPEMALPRSSSGKSNYLGYIYTHTGQLFNTPGIKTIPDWISLHT